MNIDRRQSRESLGPLVQDLLHAIGQPITSLQMCVLLRDQPALDHKEVATFIEDTANQVTQLSRLFDTLRRLLDADPAPRMTAQEVERLLATILPQWRQAAFQKDIKLTVTGVQEIEQSHAHRACCRSTETSLQDIFAAALESTSSLGSTTVTVVARSGTMSRQLQILGGNLLPPASFAARFALPAAQALFKLNDQEFTYSLNPFKASLILPEPAPSVADAAAIASPLSDSENHAGIPG